MRTYVGIRSRKEKTNTFLNGPKPGWEARGMGTSYDFLDSRGFPCGNCFQSIPSVSETKLFEERNHDGEEARENVED